MPDPYFFNTPVLLPFDGTDGSASIQNAGSKTLALTVNGNAKLSAEQSKFGGTSLKLNGDADLLSFPDVSLGNGDWTIECWVYFRTAPSTYAALMVRSGVGGIYYYGGNLIQYPYATGNNSPISINTWHHICAMRSADKLYLYVDGVAGSSTPTVGGEFIISAIGADGSRVQGSQSYIDDVRITVGIARYEGNFTPPGAHDATRPDLFAKGMRIPVKAAAVPTTTASVKAPHLTTASRKEADLFYGGNGRVSGSVKKKGAPDTPVSTRVRLYTDRDGVMIRETWSDPVTGAYSFGHIAMNVKYTVITYDHTHNFRAVVADNLTPELMQ